MEFKCKYYMYIYIVGILFCYSSVFSKNIKIIGYGVELSVPKSWSCVNAGEDNVKLKLLSPTDANDNFQENVTIIEGDEASYTNPQQYRDGQLENLKQLFPNFKIAGESKDKNGLFWYEFDYSVSGVMFKSKQAIQIKNKKVYVLTYVALSGTYNSYLSVFNSILNSFNIYN